MDAGRLSQSHWQDRQKEPRNWLAISRSLPRGPCRRCRNMALLLRSLADVGRSRTGFPPWVMVRKRDVAARRDLRSRYRADNVSEDLPDPLKLCVYRMVQEALNNARSATPTQKMASLNYARQETRSLCEDLG